MKSPTGHEAVAIAQKLVENAPQAILFVTPEGCIVFGNRRAAELATPCLNGLAGSSFWEAFPELADPEAKLEIRKAIEEQTGIEFDRRMSNGRWLHLSIRPDPAGFAIYAKDVTAHKLAEQERQEHEEEILDFLQNGSVALHWVGPDGTILWANAAELELLGYRAEEYVGHNIREFHVDTLVIHDILARLSNGEKLTNRESRLRCKNGSIVNVAISSSVYRKNGKFVHTRCFTRDITSDKARTELQERLGAIVHSSDDAIVSKDLNGIIKSWNKSAERLFGFTAEEAVGQPVASLLIPEDRQEEEPGILARLRRGERVDHFQTKRKRKDGVLLDVSLTISPVKDADGGIVGASKIARDITEQVQKEKALRAANEALKRSNADLEQFAYSASHDLQEPLRMVSLYAEMLRRRYSGKLDSDADEFISFIVEGGSRMERLLHDLRVYTQAAIAPQAPPPAADSQRVLNNTLTSLKAVIVESGAQITSGPLPPVQVHEFQLEQVLQNIIANAIHYRGEAPPEIHIAAERDGNYWRFSVRDNGIGIDPEYKEHIFGIFKRLHSAADFPGTGMGLAICQRIVERSGGSIWVESSPGRGATFFFTLPEARAS